MDASKAKYPPSKFKTNPNTKIKSEKFFFLALIERKRLLERLIMDNLNTCSLTKKIAELDFNCLTMGNLANNFSKLTK